MVLLVSAGSALAQEEPTFISVAGILEKPGYTPEGYGPYAITDETTGVRYVVDYVYYDGDLCVGPVLSWEYLDSSVGYRHIVSGLVLEGYDAPVLSLEMLSYAPAGYPPYPDVARGCDQTVGNWVPAAA